MDDKSGDFEWQTDNDDGWELTTSQHSQTLTKQRRKWQFFKLGFLIIILISTIIGGFLIIDERADRTEQRMTAEVVNSHTLLRQAVDENDDELFSELLSSRDIAWRSLQEDLLRRRLIFGRTSFGLLKAPKIDGDRVGSNQTVQLGDDLRTAEVVDQVSYSIASGENNSKTLSLEMTFQYQREGPSWKYVSPSDDTVFWGKWSHIEMENLTVVVAQRDHDLGQLFSNKLDPLVEELCSESEINCPTDFHLRLQLDRQPRSLLRLGERLEGELLGTGNGQYSIVLPTPTLVGRPIDETGNDVLYKSYAGRVAAIIITSYLVMNNEGGGTYLAEYLTEKDLQLPLAPDPVLPRAAENTLQDKDALPAQDLLMVCSANQQINLWRYNPIHNRWTDELANVGREIFDASPTNSDVGLHRLPGVEGVLLSLHQMIAEESRWRTYLLQDAESHLMLDEEIHYFYWPSLFFSWSDPSLGRVTAFRLSQEDPQNDTLSVGWYDIQECKRSTCELKSIEGIPSWSPDGNLSIIFQGFNGNFPILSVGDENGQVIDELGPGSPVGWLDTNHFAYLLMSNDLQDQAAVNGFDELVVTTINRQGGDIEIAGTETIIKASDLGDLIVDEAQNEQLTIDSALAVDGEIKEWIVVVSFPEGNAGSVSYVLKLVPGQSVTNIVTTLEGALSFPAVLGQRAGFVAIAWQAEDTLHFKILDAADGKVLWHGNALPYDWSDDGEWLVFVEQGRLRLVAPQTRHEIVIPYDLRGCYSAVWASRHP